MKNYFLNYFKKFLLYFFLILGIFGISQVVAQDDISSGDFVISVSMLDPIHGQQAKSTESGLWVFRDILEIIGNVFLMLIPLLGGVSFVIAGYFYIFSYADSDNITKAKTIIKYNIIAIIVAFMSGGIIHIIASLL